MQLGSFAQVRKVDVPTYLYHEHVTGFPGFTHAFQEVSELCDRTTRRGYRVI